MQTISKVCHDDVIKWKHFPRYWPFVRGIHRSPANSPHTGQWCGALAFSLIYAWINGGVFFDLRLNKRLRKQSWGWWFEMPSRSLWGHCNDHFRRNELCWHNVRYTCIEHAFRLFGTKSSPETMLIRCQPYTRNIFRYFGETLFKISIFSFSENAFENAVCKLWAILFKPQCKNNKYTGSSRVRCDYLVGCSTQNANTIPTYIYYTKLARTVRT